MLDVHPPHQPAHTWKDFFIHIGTIAVGLLLAIALEQGVEWLHHRHQRHQLQEDLRTEAESNRGVIARDLQIQRHELWFTQTETAIGAASPPQGKLRLTLPTAPCLPGTVGTSDYRYFAPSEAVWTTARESGLVSLLPVEQGRMYARLAHNYALLAVVRENVYNACHVVLSMQQRLARPVAPGRYLWTLTAEQAEKLAQASADARLAMKSLCFRLRWSDIYEKGLLDGENKADIQMMTIDQARFEDEEDRPNASQP